MTGEEVLRRYKIPAEILDEYEPQGQEYDDSDIERISTIMTLNDIGFKKEDRRQCTGTGKNRNR